MSYQLLQEDPALFLLMFAISFVLTIFVYGLFPWVFAKTRKTLITKKKYKRLCYGINAIGMLFFILLNGASSGVPYVLWTTIFYRRGIKTLGKRGVMPDSEYFNSGKNQLVLCVRCGHRESSYTEQCVCCGGRSLQFVFVQKETDVLDKICFCRNCGANLTEDSHFCLKCGTEVVEV